MKLELKKDKTEIRVLKKDYTFYKNKIDKLVVVFGGEEIKIKDESNYRYFLINYDLLNGKCGLI